MPTTFRIGDLDKRTLVVQSKPPVKRVVLIEYLFDLSPYINNKFTFPNNTEDNEENALIARTAVTNSVHDINIRIQLPYFGYKKVPYSKADRCTTSKRH
jgi:hypothetical protein